jgi:predicted transglutaminase-like cysteine proteinase
MIMAVLMAVTACSTYGSSYVLADVTDVNNHVNDAIEFGTDQDNWGVRDYWTSPDELFALGSGDCEDYAIAKYFILLKHGTDADRLKLWYVSASVGAHMVLAYDWYPVSSTYDPLILDNLVPMILPLSQRNDLVLIFSFDQDTRNIKRWNNVLIKARSEGYIK